MNPPPLAGSKAQHPLEHYLKTRFYGDTAAGNPGALRLAIETYGIERVVFASDFPFYPMPDPRRCVEENLEPQAAHQVYGSRVPGLRLPSASPATASAAMLRPTAGQHSPSSRFRILQSSESARVQTVSPELAETTYSKRAVFLAHSPFCYAL